MKAHHFYSLLQFKTAEKRNFLRKGDGKVRISKSNEKIQPASKSTASTELLQHQRPSSASTVQQSDKNRWTNCSPHTHHSSSPTLENLSLMRKGKVKCSDQRPDQENRLLTRSDDSKSLAVDHDQQNFSQQYKEHSKQPNQRKLQDGCLILSGQKVAPKIHLFTERIGFKKVNDRIVRVCDLDQANTQTVSLTTETKQLLFNNTSGDFTGPEDDPKTLPCPDPLRINSDHNLDLSDEDYASDAPSDAGPSEYPQASRCFSAQLSSSSGSDDESESELQQLCWSEPLKETSNPNRPWRARSSDILTRIFPHMKCTGETKTEIWEQSLKTQNFMNGEDHSY